MFQNSQQEMKNKWLNMMGHIDHLCCIKRGKKGPGVFIKNIETKKKKQTIARFICIFEPYFRMAWPICQF